MTDNTPMQLALDGLRVGDAFGFKLSIRPDHLAHRRLPEGPWSWSDDTAMALSLAAVLSSKQHVDQDLLFDQFVTRYKREPRRGYGSGMKKLLGRTPSDQWRSATPNLFAGQGSLGNGAAMRAPVLGAFFCHDLDLLVEQATLSATVTHAHPEGIAGAIAVALATAIKHNTPSIQPQDLLQRVAKRTPLGPIKQGLEDALSFGPEDFAKAAIALGNGHLITAADTVPFCIWWAAHAPDSFEEALWTLVGAKGDEDTNCAIVGGILAAAELSPPDAWLNLVEAQPTLEILPEYKDPYS